MARILENALVIYTDGSLYAKGRRGGYGARFLYFDEVGEEHILEEYWEPGIRGTTINRMELEACITALKKAPGFECFTTVNKVVIRTDSRYISEYYMSALGFWRKNRWKNRDGKAVDNADLWKAFVRHYEKVRKPKNIEWVKGHGKGREKDPHNYAADKLAKQSAQSPLSRKVYRSSARRKTSPNFTRPGSIEAHGQVLLIRVVETTWLRVQKIWKYRCEVVSFDSPYYQNLDWLYSNEQMRDGHYYEVQLNDNPRNPTITIVIRELEYHEDE